MKLYTTTGDKGTTSLIGGERVSKTDLRVEAYGTLDELSSFVALLADKMRQRGLDSEKLLEINSVLMNIEAITATGLGGEGKVSPLKETYIQQIETSIDELEKQTDPITKFTIPGGDETVSLCHVCRTVCRRAERAMIRVEQTTGLDHGALIYVNRLSDFFYILGRAITKKLEIEEILWRP